MLWVSIKLSMSSKWNKNKFRIILFFGLWSKNNSPREHQTPYFHEGIATSEDIESGVHERIILKSILRLFFLWKRNWKCQLTRIHHVTSWQIYSVMFVNNIYSAISNVKIKHPATKYGKKNNWNVQFYQTHQIRRIVS